jgi:hypothetical protein
MITINNFEIINSGQQLAIDVETDLDYNITSVLLWNIDTFKDYSLATNLNFKLEQIDNKEIFIVDVNELNILEFKDIYFIEIESNVPVKDCSTCLIPALGITYNILPYYQCMLNYLLKTEITDCVTCNDLPSKNLLITINLLIDSIEKSLDLGYYLQAIDNIKKLKKLCSLQECTNCKTVICNTCSQFKQVS